MPETSSLPRRLRRAARRTVNLLEAFAALLAYYPYKWRMRLGRQMPTRLHVGCGRNSFPGWINADTTPRAELIVFLERRLPFANDTLDRIYSEHVLEHVPYETGVFFLKEAFRTLRPGGCVRIAMPDLQDLVAGYCNGDWKRFDWVNWPEHAFIVTRAEMINVAFRWWGHQHLYDRQELSRALLEAGFEDFRFVRNGESELGDLRGLETRLDSTLVAEATKS
ncbi:MAG: methyltransferase domain-containing protein [Phycisphaerales bacterium]|nr:MAG: methyltransferase domain-containing protein [Phycisphaerales bacterium]